MISKDKTYCTRGGQQVRIYATDAGGLFPVHGAIFTDGIWNGMKWTAEGHTHVNLNSYVHVSMDDLAEVKPRHKRTVWINVVDDLDYWHVYTSKENADKFSHGRIACLKVDLDFQEGEGLTETVYSVGSGGGSGGMKNGGGFTPFKVDVIKEGK